MTLHPPDSFERQLARTLTARPGRVAAVALVLALAGAALASRWLRLDTDRTALIGLQHRFNQNFAELQAEFGDLDAMVVLVEAPERAAARVAVDRLAARISADPERFPGMFHRVPEEALAGRALLFLDLDEVLAIEARLRIGGGPAAALLARGLGAFFSAAAAMVLDVAADPDLAAAASPSSLAFLGAFADSTASALGGQAPPAPWEAWIPAGALAGRDGYTWTEDGRAVLLVQPQRAAGPLGASESVARLRELLGEEAAAHPDVSLGLTGEPVLEVDELETFWRDARTATLVSLGGVTLLFVVAMRRLLGPLLAMASLGAAILVTLGLATVWPGRLNLISGTFCALLVGLGIDYAIHWISRYDEERARGLDPQTALAAALTACGRAMAAGAVTTALAFLATLFTDVEGIREFGVISGVGVLLSFFAAATLLPALVCWSDRGRGGRPGRPRPRWGLGRTAQGIDHVVATRPGWVVAVSAAAAAGALAYALGVGAGAPRLPYDANLLALQDAELESVRLGAEVLADKGLSGMFGAVVCADETDLARVTEQVRALETVADTASILDVVPPDQAAKRAALGRVAALLASLPDREANLAGDPERRLAALRRGVAVLIDRLDDAARGVLAGGPSGAASWVLGLIERLEALDEAAAAPGAAERLARHEVSVLAQLRGALSRLRGECAPPPITVDTLPAPVRDRFVGRSGKLLLRVYPAVDPWDDASLQRFVRDLQAAVPDVGGVPVQLYKGDRLIRRGYRRAARLALVFVACALLVHFRSAVRPAVAVVTLGVAVAWGVGLLCLLGVGLNPANLLALPLILGIGIDYAIHMVHRDGEAREASSLAAAPAVVATSTGRAVFLSALTTSVGFGALVLSTHRGVASIGVTICVGVGTSLVAALVFCPALLRLLSGPSRPLDLIGLPGPRTGPGGEPRRPGQDPPPS